MCWKADAFVKSNSPTGNHAPRLEGVPRLLSNGAPLPFFGVSADKTPRLLPANLPRPATLGPDSIGVQFANESPEVHVDQDWVLTWEGNIPGFDGLSATMSTEDDYASLRLTQPNGRFCAKGVEDWELGRARAAAIASDVQRLTGAPPLDAQLDRHITDYVQLTEDLLPVDDPYWSLSDDPGKCWAPELPPGQKRYDVCAATFGGASDQSPARDFPIVEAYQDSLVVGAFGPLENGVRDVIYKNKDYNAARLKLARCCFHHQVRFHVRTGGVWSLVGFIPGTSAVGVGFLSHLTSGDAGRCVASCEPRESLLSSRVPAGPAAVVTAPGRNSPLAVRNPMMSFWVANGVPQQIGVDNGKPVFVEGLPLRDTFYEVHTRGSFTALTINLAAATVAVSPQSMRFIDTLGQLAVVDAASQGLVLIDLGTVGVAHAPYF